MGVEHPHSPLAVTVNLAESWELEPPGLLATIE